MTPLPWLAKVYIPRFVGVGAECGVFMDLLRGGLKAWAPPRWPE